ncbi:MAG TPA: hypothetical protein VGC22_00725 [Chitinophaga sp.]
MENGMTTIAQTVKAVRKKPLQFLGSTNHNGVVNMVRYLLEDLPAADLPQLTVDIAFYPGNRVHLTFSNLQHGPLAAIFQANGPSGNDQAGQAPGILLALNTDVKISVHTANATGVLYGGQGAYALSDSAAQLPLHTGTVEFTLDPEVFGPLEISYGFFNLFLQQFAYLNPGVTIISTDHRAVYQHNVFHYPRGIAEQVDAYVSGYNAPILRLDLHTRIDGHEYQVSLCFLFNARSKPKPQVRSFAGSEETPGGGSHLDGALKGFRMALKEIAGQDKEKRKIKISRKKVAANLSGIVAIKGPALHFAGSSIMELDMPAVKKQLQHYVFMQTVDYLHNHPDITAQLLQLL